MNISPLISTYKELFGQDNNAGEVYKWTAFEHFRSNRNLKAGNFAGTLQAYLSKRGNLMYQNGWEGICSEVVLYPERFRSMNRQLFNEKENIIREKAAELLASITKTETP